MKLFLSLLFSFSVFAQPVPSGSRVTVPGGTVIKPIIFGAQVNSTGTTITRKIGSQITSVGCSGGAFTVNFTTMAVAPICFITWIDSTYFRFAPTSAAATTSSFTWLGANNSTTYVCGDYFIMCFGSSL